MPIVPIFSNLHCVITVGFSHVWKVILPQLDDVFLVQRAGFRLKM